MMMVFLIVILAAAAIVLVILGRSSTSTIGTINQLLPNQLDVQIQKCKIDTSSTVPKDVEGLALYCTTCIGGNDYKVTTASKLSDDCVRDKQKATTPLIACCGGDVKDADLKKVCPQLVSAAPYFQCTAKNPS